MYTNGRLRSIGSGALKVALLQSSSAVSLMVLAFVGAGVMSMQNAIGVIVGSNIGTTLTAGLLPPSGLKSKLRKLALPFIGLAAGVSFCLSASSAISDHTAADRFRISVLGLDFIRKVSVESLRKALVWNGCLIMGYGFTCWPARLLPQ
ncbi:MAG: Na/Pi symporter [Desulfobacterales bacterium]